MFRRTEGLVISIIVMGEIYNYIKVLNLWMIIIIVYVILVSIEFLPEEFLEERMSYL
jgi:energy-converting hydrogenase Eha subunit H